jgi:phage head maturation protease
MVEYSAAMPTFTLTDSSVNVYGFRVLTEGVDLSAFRNNPVMLYNHQRDDMLQDGDRRQYLPIGRWDNVRVDADRILADTDIDEQDTFAASIKQKVDAGYLNGASMGLKILATSEAPEDMLEGQDLPTITKSVAFEASITDLPGNVNSLQLYNADGERINLDNSNDPRSLLLSAGGQKPQSIPNQNDTDMKSIAVYLGLSQDAGENQVLEQLKQKDVKLTQAEQDLEQKKQELQQKDSKITELNNQLNQGQAEALVDGAIQAGKITQQERDAYLSLAQNDYDNTKKVLDSMSGHQSINRRLNNQTQTEANKDWTFRDYEQKDPDKLAQLKRDEPETYKELFRAQYGTEPKNV